MAQDLIANDESEISEVVRRRLFEDLGSVRVRRKIARTYAAWCFERSNRLPPEWLAVDTATTESGAREFLKNRFEACYPFHPATLSVFNGNGALLPNFSRPGGVGLLAQWISWAAHEHFHKARAEPLITLGSAPLDVPEFRSVVLGQLGETRLDAAIDADIAGTIARARSLDKDTSGSLRDIHRRVGAAILFESSGGQVDKVAHLPELRFALGEPEIETTSIDNAAMALESLAFFIRKVGTDGYRIHHQATLKKVVSDRQASLDEETEIRPAIRKLVEGEFKSGATLPVVFFPEDSTAVQDSPRLSLVVLDPETEWQGEDLVAERIGHWTRERGSSPRLYPGSLVWCVRKQGRELRRKVELWLAWQRVRHELAQGILGTEYERSDRQEVEARIKEMHDAARDEVWASYRFVALWDNQKKGGLRVIDLGAGHSSASETLCGRIITALKTEALLNENVGAGYVERHWPPAFQESGALATDQSASELSQRRIDSAGRSDTILRRQIIEFVTRGDFGLASGSGKMQLRAVVVRGTAPCGRGGLRNECLPGDQGQIHSNQSKMRGSVTGPTRNHTKSGTTASV